MYRLTPRAVTYIAAGWAASALAIWLAHRWQAVWLWEFVERRS